MRPLLAVAVVALGIECAAPSPEYRPAVTNDQKIASLVPSEVDSLAPREDERSAQKGDREAIRAVATVAPTDAPAVPPTVIDVPEQGDDPELAEAVAAITPGFGFAMDDDGESGNSLDALCNSLMNSAQANDLPVPFFANLIWQESRLQHDAVSRVGAQGIAQFMPSVATEVGLHDPFDPHQALPASARLLRDLHAQFGNLGYAAAAYNAGPRRVGEWLDHHRTLPRETRTYVVRVTGRSIEEWRKSPRDGSGLTFVRRLPCRELPAFADLEQRLQLAKEARGQDVSANDADAQEAQSQEAQPEEADSERTVSRRHFVRHHRFAWSRQYAARRMLMRHGREYGHGYGHRHEYGRNYGHGHGYGHERDYGNGHGQPRYYSHRFMRGRFQPLANRHEFHSRWVATRHYHYHAQHWRRRVAQRG